MKVGDEIHFSAVEAREKGIEYSAGWARECVWTLWKGRPSRY